MTIDSVIGDKKMTSLCEVIFKRHAVAQAIPSSGWLCLNIMLAGYMSKHYAKSYARNSARLAGLALKQPPSAVVCVLDEVSIMPRDFTQ